MKNARVLCIPDLHIPAQHPEALEFLDVVDTEFQPDRVVNLGDVHDLARFNYHEQETEMYGALEEVEDARVHTRTLYEMFPQMDIVWGNHDLLFYRKAKTAGLPMDLIKGPNEFWGVGKGWKWHFDLTLTLSNSEDVYFHHSKGADILRVSQAMGMSVVSGHLHEKMGVQFWANPKGLYFAAQGGCLVDHDALAMSYARNNLKRPLLGCIVIEDGMPRVVPMTLARGGQWTGEVVL